MAAQTFQIDPEYLNGVRYFFCVSTDVNSTRSLAMFKYDDNVCDVMSQSERNRDNLVTLILISLSEA